MNAEVAEELGVEVCAKVADPIEIVPMVALGQDATGGRKHEELAGRHVVQAPVDWAVIIESLIKAE